MSTENYLSSPVGGMLDHLKEDVVKSNCSSLDELSDDFVLNILQIDVTTSDFNDIWYSNNVKKLTLFSHLCNERMKKLDYEDCEQYLAWLTNPKRFNQVVINSFENSVFAYEALLICTAIYERSLGNLLYSADITPVPSLLRDLIASPSLSEIIGYGRVCILKLLMGSPKSLNIRNLAWHGFLLPKDINVNFIPMFCILAIDIGKTIMNKNFNIKMREQVRFVNTFPYLELDKLDRVKWPVDMDDKWIQRAKELTWHEKYLTALCLQLPLLELLLRIMFTQSNNCPNRMLTAENTEFYTTFKEILDQFVPPGGQMKNQLVIKLDRSILNLIFDLIVLPDGPRIRDKISHGEVDFDSETELKSLCSTIWLLLDILCSIYNGNDNPQLANYHAKCHPVSFVCENLCEISKLAEQLQSYKMPDLTDLETEHPQIVNCLELNEFSLERQILNCDKLDTAFYANMQENFHIETLFRPRNEYIILSQLKRLSSEMKQIYVTILHTLDVKCNDFKVKSLSRRQSNTFRKMIIYLPSISQVILNLTCLIACILICKYDIGQSQECQKVIDKGLKGLLKKCENMERCLHKANNKWDEAKQIGEEIQQATDHLNKHIYQVSGVN